MSMVHGYPVDKSILDCNFKLGTEVTRRDSWHVPYRQIKTMSLLLACCKVQFVAQSESYNCFIPAFVRRC